MRPPQLSAHAEELPELLSPGWNLCNGSIPTSPQREQVALSPYFGYFGLYFGPDGGLLGKHRKLKPTAAERIVWGEGDGSTLTALDTELGTLGGLICWEHYMPLARAAMYGKGVQVWLAPTADSRDTWQATMGCGGRVGRESEKWSTLSTELG